MNDIDHALVLYTLFLIVSLYGLALFSWGWYRSKRVSAMFACVTLLYGAETWSRAFDVVARWLRCSGDMPAYYAFMGSPAWAFRSYPALFALTTIATYWTVKVCRQRNTSKERGN